ncbi:MAG: zinc ribbon domain-containing protein [Promethearchaeota archaeon]
MQLVKQVQLHRSKVLDASGCGVIKKSNRKHRGLYVCQDCGTVLNADVNASNNILHKGVLQFVRIGDRGCLNHPIVLKVA